VNDYFASTSSELATSFSSEDGKKAESTTVDQEPHRIRVLSWNIDGLDNNSINLRTKAVCQTIEKYADAFCVYIAGLTASWFILL